MPNNFIAKQLFYGTTLLPVGISAAYNYDYDIIVMDADATSGIGFVSPAFLLGHEIGHKIDFYKGMEEAKREIADSLMISSDYVDYLTELFADVCGSIVDGRPRLPRFEPEIEPEKVKYMQTLALRNIYRP